MISAPAPKMLMQASVKQALRRLDNVDPEVKAFFMGAAKTVAEGADPVGALASALGCLSGLTEVPKDRSLLTQVRHRIMHVIHSWLTAVPHAASPVNA